MFAKKKLGGGFKYLLLSPLLGEDSHFDEHIFQMGDSTTDQLYSDNWGKLQIFNLVNIWSTLP